MKIVFSLSLALSVSLLTGCGSFGARWQGDRGPYVGVQQAARSVAARSNESEIIVSAADVPLCAIVDTLLLPFDLAAGPSHQNKPPSERYNSGRVGYK